MNLETVVRVQSENWTGNIFQLLTKDGDRLLFLLNQLYPDKYPWGYSLEDVCEKLSIEDLQTIVESSVEIV